MRLFRDNFSIKRLVVQWRIESRAAEDRSLMRWTNQIKAAVDDITCVLEKQLLEKNGGK